MGRAKRSPSPGRRWVSLRSTHPTATHARGGRRLYSSIAIISKLQLQAHARELVALDVADCDRDGFIFREELARAVERLVFGAELLDAHRVVEVPVPARHGQSIPIEYPISHDSTPS